MYLVLDSRHREIRRFAKASDALDYVSALLFEGRIGKVEFDANA
jgi:hypothetical protein